MSAWLPLAGAAASGAALGCVAGLRVGPTVLARLFRSPWPLASLAGLGLLTWRSAGLLAVALFALGAVAAALLQQTVFATQLQRLRRLN